MSVFVLEAGDFQRDPALVRPEVDHQAGSVWEMTWSYLDPAGRATFAWVQIDSEAGIRWRRIGGHAVLGEP